VILFIDREAKDCGQRRPAHSKPSSTTESSFRRWWIESILLRARYSFSVL